MKLAVGLKLLLGIVATVLLSGCGALDGWLVRRFHAAPIETQVAIVRLENTYSNLTEVEENLETAYKTNSVTPIEAARQRDRILNDLIHISDYYYDQFKHRSFTDNAAWNTGFDLTSIGLSSAATLVGGPAAQALSATDTGIKAAQGKINERWLANRTIPVLVATMDAMRAETLATIYGKMGKPYDQFGIAEGIRLVAKYHQQASLLEAMDRLAADANQKKSENESQVVRALRSK